MLDLTFGTSFKVRQWFTGFGELSFQWIQICIGSPMCTSTYTEHNGEKIIKIGQEIGKLWLLDTH